MYWWTWALIIAPSLLLAGQLLATVGDAYLSVQKPNPIGGKTVEITILYWGFAAKKSRLELVDDCQRLGINDMRFFTTPRQTLICFVTFGLVRKISIAYRCFAGDPELGDL